MGGEFRVWDAANRIILEDIGNLGDSVLKSVYQDADRVLYNIIKDEQKKEKSDFHRDEQIANVVSFIGKKGRGKTSAMMTFYDYLDRLQDDKQNGWSKFVQAENVSTPVSFCTLECIDAAALAKNEFLIDVLLAKMWQKVQKISDDLSYKTDRQDYEYLLKQVREELITVRKSYLNLRYKETNGDKDLEKEKDKSIENGLQELSSSINLKKGIKKLVSNYMKLINNKNDRGYSSEGYLVLAIDDVDMAKSRAWDILEQIRQYLSMPQIIIFMTTDIDRLRDVCEQSIKNEKCMSNDVSRYVSDYLDKVLPINKRVYLPEISLLRDNVVIAKSSEFTWKNNYEKEIILELIANNCDIYFDNTRRKFHFLQNKSLRSLVNYFNGLTGMASKEVEDKYVKKEKYLSWLRNDLHVRLIERVDSSKQKQYLCNLIEQDYSDINNSVINYLENAMRRRSRKNILENSMGQVLYLCNLFELEDIKNVDFVNAILVFYSLILTDETISPEMRDAIVGDSVFGEWEYSIRGQKQVTISGFDKRAELQLSITQDVKDHISHKNTKKAMEELFNVNRDKLLAWSYMFLYVDIMKPANGQIEFDIDMMIDPEESFCVMPSIGARYGAFSFLYKNITIYKELIELMLQGAVVALYNYMLHMTGGKHNEKELSALMKKYKSCLDDMHLFENPIKEELIHSVEILYGLGKCIEKHNNESEQWVAKLATSYMAMEKLLKEIDCYYSEDVQIETNFEACFREYTQVKLLLEKKHMSANVRESFEEHFRLMFGGVSIERVPSPR